MAYMLVQACEEVIEEGGNPESDVAVTLLSGRIGFASPADTMSAAAWNGLIDICEQEIPAQIKLSSTVAIQ